MRYNVSIIPELKTTSDGFSVYRPAPDCMQWNLYRVTVEADSLDELQECIDERVARAADAKRAHEFDHLAGEEGEDYLGVSVFLDRGARKPRGFDARFGKDRHVPHPLPAPAV